MSGDELDRAIDEVVGGMMRAEPSARLRDRVMRGIGQPLRRAWLTTPRLATGIGAAACLAVVALLVGRELSAPRSAQVPRTAVATSQAPSAPGSRPVVEPDAADAAAERPVAHRGKVHIASRQRSGGDARMATAASFRETESSIVISPLETVEPINVERVTTGSIDIADLVIAPLHIEPVHVDPLSSLPR